MPKKKSRQQYVSWTSLALMCFCTIWSFAGVQNAYYYFGQTKSLIVLVVVYVLYLVPYALIVGELGSTFKNCDGGLSGWVRETIGPNFSYFAGWISWVVMLPYLSQRPSNIILSCNWIINQNADISYIGVTNFQIIAAVIFIIILAFAFRGFKLVHIISTIGGSAIIIFALLYIICTFFAPVLNIDPVNVKNYSLVSNDVGYIPSDLTFILSLSILIFNVAGVEQVGPYIPKMKKPGKEFPKSILITVGIVILVTVLGVVAMCIMFGPNGEEMGSDFITNGQFLAFQKLGHYFGIGNTLVIVYSILRLISEIALTMIIIDAPIRMLVEASDSRFFPKRSLVANKFGTYPVWLFVEGIIVTFLIILPIFGIEGVDDMIKWLLEVNSICSPLINICAFLAYIFLKSGFKKVVPASDAFVFVKSKKLGMFFGIWCLSITFFAIILQIYDVDWFKFLSKALIPIFLLGFGLIIPFFAKILNKNK